jgi:hypothetical protein
MSVKQDLANWKQRLNVSHRAYEYQQRENEIYKRYYQNDQWLNEELSSRFMDKVTDNIVFPNIRSIVPRLNFRNPRIFVSPRKKPYKTKDGIFDTIAGSMALEILLNHEYKELQTKRESRRCLYDALLGHWGVMEIGYTLKTEKVKDKELLEVDELIKEERVFTKRRSPADLRIDTEGTDHLLNDRRWIALRWVKSLEDIKRDDKYSNTKGLQLNFSLPTRFGQSTSYEKNQDRLDGLTEDPELFGRVEGWDLWDKKERRIYTIVEEHDKYLRNDKWPDWADVLEGFPIEILYMNENPDEQFPLPDIQIYKKTQDEINMLGSMQMSHVRRISERKFLARTNALEHSEERKLIHGGNVIVHTDLNPETAVVPIKDAPISQDIYIIQKLKKTEASEQALVSPLEKGGIQKFDTATEPALLNAAMQNVREDQRSLFEDFIVRIERKVAMVLQNTTEKRSVPLDSEQFRDISQLIRSKVPGLQGLKKRVRDRIEKIVGEDGKDILQPWINLDKKDIQGEYDFTIEIGSTQPINQEKRKRDALQLAAVLKGNPYIRGREATMRMLEAFEVMDKEKLVKSEQEVLRQRQMLQEQAVQGEIQKDLPKRQVDMAKTVKKTQSAEKIAQGKNVTTLLTSKLKGQQK